MSGKNCSYRPKSSYNLADVKSKIVANKVVIMPNARQQAFTDFGWQWGNILDAYSKLQTRHFYKTEQSKVKFPIWIDVYKAHLNGEDIYTHFYINDSGYLVINSFKNDQKGLKS